LIEDPELQDHDSEQEATQPLVADKFVDGEDNDGDMIVGPTVEAHVHLARTASMCFLITIIINTHTTSSLSYLSK
jgi:hypothetical protein